MNNPHHRDAYSVERGPLGSDCGDEKSTKVCDEKEALSILVKAGKSLKEKRTSICKENQDNGKDSEEKIDEIKRKRLPSSAPSGLRFWHARSQKKLIDTTVDSKNSSSES